MGLRAPTPPPSRRSNERLGLLQNNLPAAERDAKIKRASAKRCED